MKKRKGIWDERNKRWILPNGTVRQGRRPMFQPFVKHDHLIQGEGDSCAICKANVEAQRKGGHPDNG